MSSVKPKPENFFTSLAHKLTSALSLPLLRNRGGMGRNPRPPGNIALSLRKHLKAFKSTAALVYYCLCVDKSWSPGVSALTWPIWKQEGKHKPVCACQFISWPVRACFLCIGPDMASHCRDFTTGPLLPLESHHRPPSPALWIVSCKQFISKTQWVTFSRLAHDRISIENGFLENGRCISRWCLVTSRQWFKPRGRLWFFSTMYQCAESRRGTHIFTPSSSFVVRMNLCIRGRAVLWWLWFQWTQIQNKCLISLSQGH